MSFWSCSNFFYWCNETDRVRYAEVVRGPEPYNHPKPCQWVTIQNSNLRPDEDAGPSFVSESDCISESGIMCHCVFRIWFSILWMTIKNPEIALNSSLASMFQWTCSRLWVHYINMMLLLDCHDVSGFLNHQILINIGHFLSVLPLSVSHTTPRRKSGTWDHDGSCFVGFG